MERPGCVVHAWDVAAIATPVYAPPRPGIGALLRKLGDTAGLATMGVALRVVAPGDAGTHRHFHMVEEEWAYVVSGRGAVRIGPLRLDVAAGDFVAFPPGPRPHHFVAAGDAPLVLLEGGERRRVEDHGRYVDLGLAWAGGKLFDAVDPLPAEEGDDAQLVHGDALAEIGFQHPVDASAFRHQRPLSRSCGLLQRQVVSRVRLDAGAASTALHTHDRTAEWVFVIDGRAQVRVGDTTFEAGRHDFIAHPPASPPHRMQALEPTTYLVGGQHDPADVVLYPEAALRLVGGRFEAVVL